MNTQQTTELHLRQITNLLRRRWKLMAISGLIAVAVAGLASLIIAPRYTAKAQIVIDPPKADHISGQPSSAGMLDDAAVETQVAMLVSEGHLQRVFESLVAEQKGDATKVQGGEASAIEVPDIENLKRNVRAFKENRSRVIGVTYTSTSQTSAAAVANRTVQLFVAAQIERKRAERNESMNSLKDHTEVIETRVRQLQQRLATLQNASTEGRQPDATLRELQRQATTATQLHESLLLRQRELLLEWQDRPEVRVLSLALIPNLPSSPNPILFILPALAVVLIGAGLLAVLLERLDHGLRSEQDVKDALGVSCIGLIPKVAGHGKLRPHDYLLQQPFAPYTEAIRSAAASALQLTHPQKAPKVFLVTSSVRSEGTTTLALSFAVYAAQLQRRVLFIDLDLRNSVMPCGLGAAADNRNLDVLRSDLPLAGRIGTVPELGLDYLRVRHDSADPIAMLANSLPNMLRELKESYGCVVIDSAPLLGTTEPRLLASMVDKVLFVVKWGSTRREMAQNALRLLWYTDSRLQNRTYAVVTQVDLEMHARYRHGDFSESLFNLESDPTRAQAAEVIKTRAVIGRGTTGLAASPQIH